MCYSFESSINSWFFILVCSIVLLIYDTKKTNVWIAAFSLVFGQIQIIEALLHKTNYDTTISRYIPVLLWAQAITQSLGAYNVSKNKYMLLMFIFYLVMAINDYIKQDKIIVTKESHLIWNRYDKNGNHISILGNKILDLAYICGIFIPLIFIPDKLTKYSLYTYGILSLAYSLFTYGGSFSSNWCYIAAGYTVIALIASIINKSLYNT